MIAAIVCVDKNWGIGYNGDLLVKIPEDMKFFKETTMDEVVIMGRKTYDSLPVRPLPNRENIVITNKFTPNKCGICKNEDGSYFYSLNRVKDVLKFVQSCDNSVRIKDMFIIGGGTIYKELLPYCDTVFVTEVDYAFENVDTYFPNLNELHDWHISEINAANEYKGMKYRFCVYEKRNEG